MTEIFEITAKQSKWFLDLDPYRLSSLTRKGGVHTFVAFRETEQGKLPVGIATACFAGEDVTILWLYIREDCRLRGVGEEMLYRICELARKTGAKRIHARMPGQPAGGGLFNLEYYFYERGFREVAVESYDYCLTGGSIPEHMDTGETKRGIVKPFSRLTSIQMREWSPLLQMRYGLVFPECGFDRNASFVCLGQGGELLAAILFVETDGVWFLTGSFAKSKMGARQVLIHGLDSIAERLKVRDLVHLTEVDDAFFEEIEALLGGTGDALVRDLVLEV